MSERQLTRRALLGGSLALGLAGTAACEPLWQPAADAKEPPELVTLRRALATEESLVRRYRAVRHHYPQLAARLEPILVEHRSHLGALRARVTPAPSTRSTATSSTHPSPSVPARSAVALSALAQQERDAADAHLRALAGAPAFLAQLLASIGASEASHVVLLEEL